MSWEAACQTEPLTTVRWLENGKTKIQTWVCLMLSLGPSYSGRQLGAQSTHSKLVCNTAWRKHRVYPVAQQLPSRVVPKRTENIRSQENLYTDVQGNTSHNNQNAEIMQMSINLETDKQCALAV